MGPQFAPTARSPTQQVTFLTPTGPDHRLHFGGSPWPHSAFPYSDLDIASAWRAESGWPLKAFILCHFICLLNRLKFHLPTGSDLQMTVAVHLLLHKVARVVLIIYNLFQVIAEWNSHVISTPAEIKAIITQTFARCQSYLWWVLLSFIIILTYNYIIHYWIL